VLVLSGLVLVLNVGLNILLIPSYGITGAAVASVVAILIEDVLSTLVLYRNYGLFPFRRVQIVSAVACLLPTAGFIYLLDQQSVFPNLLGMPVAVVLFVFVLVWAVGPEDLQLLERAEAETNMNFEPIHRFLK
jgi:O-antigen/teichoic acid export membrane protein